MELPKTKKGRLPVKESDLTEDEVRIGFTRLQVLHYCDIKHIQGLKEQRKQLNIQKDGMIKELADQRKEIKRLNKEIDALKSTQNKPEKIDDYKGMSPEDIKKSFWNSL